MLTFREHVRVGKSQEERKCWQVDLDAIDKGVDREFQVAMAVMSAGEGWISRQIRACLSMSATERQERSEGDVVGLFLPSA